MTKTSATNFQTEVYFNDHTKEVARLERNRLQRERYAARILKQRLERDKTCVYSTANESEIAAILKEEKRVKKNEYQRNRYASLTREEKTVTKKHARDRKRKQKQHVSESPMEKWSVMDLNLIGFRVTTCLPKYVFFQHIKARSNVGKGGEITTILVPTLKVSGFQSNIRQYEITSATTSAIFEQGSSSQQSCISPLETFSIKRPRGELYVSPSQAFMYYFVLFLLYYSFSYIGFQNFKCVASIAKSQRQNLHPLNYIPTSPYTMPIVDSCVHCKAKRFLHETPAFCCSNGSISLHYEEPPSELYELFTAHNVESQSFRKHIRSYNNMMAFTSLGVKYDKALASAVGSGVYVFRVQGQLSHFINTILPLDTTLKYLQLYFYDPLHEVDNRSRICSGFNTSIIQKLITILSDNPYCLFFRALRHEKDLVNIKIVIREDAGLDQRVYNRPTISDIALIWRDEVNGTQIHPRDIIVCGNDLHSHRVHYYFGCYDPLQYVLLCPRGETGWHWGIERCSEKNGKKLCRGLSLVDPTKFFDPESLIAKETAVLSGTKKKSSFVSIREYYAYKLQIRPNERNLLLRGGRLFQQYIVDMRNKRLQYWKKNCSSIILHWWS